MNAKDIDNLKKFSFRGDRWIALGSIGMGFPSATARRLWRMGLLERQPAPPGVSRFYDYRLTSKGKEVLEESKYKGPCVYDTDGDGNCHLCARKGGCRNFGGPFETK